MSTLLNRYTIAGLLFLVSLAGCRQPTKDEGEAKEGTSHTHEEEPTDVVELTADQLRIGGIGLGKIDYRNVSQQLTVNGRLAVPAQSQVNVSALLGGFVRSIPLLPGQRVTKGQILARVENPDLIQLQQDYAETHSRLTFLEAEFARQKELSEQNVSALKVFQQTSADLQATRARLAGMAHRMRLVGLSTQAALNGKFSSMYTLTAPVTGVVTSVSATAGQYVQPSDLIAQLTSNEGLYAELIIFEKDLSQLRENQRVHVRLTTENGRERSGYIKHINRSIEADRSVRVVAQLDQPDTRLLPNTFLKASLDLGNSRVTALPEGAIVSAEGKDYIFVVTDEHAAHHEHEEDEVGHAEKSPPDSPTGKAEQQGTAFKQILVRRGVTENGYSQVTLPASIDMTTAKVVTNGAYAVLSQLQATSGHEEGHAH